MKLSELLESAEPEFIDYDENCTSVCDRESYEKMKAIAIELSSVLEFYIKCGLLHEVCITKARGMLEGEK